MVISSNLSRREFLKFTCAAVIGLNFRDFPPGGDPTSKRPPSFLLGRTVYSLRYYEEPSFASSEMGYYITDSIVNIHEERLGDSRPYHNPIWLRTDEGWLHSAYVQPVENRLNEPVLEIPEKGMLSEVTVPYTQSWYMTGKGWKRGRRFYYASTYWVYLAFQGMNGEIWYRVLDDRDLKEYLVQAEHLRPVNSAELTQISPGIPEKLIEVDLRRQLIIAYENQKPVFTTRTATGYFEGDTPRGEFIVERKQPSRHMSSNLEGNDFDLPGVPWVCYISWTGVSLHGTYWHNNYGTPQSHGCINLTPEAAKWIYRWTEPFVPHGKDYVESENGTRVVVF